MDGWSRMSLREFHESGLLAQVNAATLWPLGLALTVVVDKETGEVEEYTELFVQRLDPFDVIVSGDSPEENEARMNRLAAWMKERIGPMTQYSAVIRKTNGDEETSLVEAGSEARAKEIADQIAEGIGEVVSVTEITAAPPEEPSDG